MELKKNMIQLAFAVILLIVGSTYFNTKYKNEQKRIDENSSYTIGEVLIYRPSSDPLLVPGLVNSTGNATLVKFKFNVNDSLYTRDYTSRTAFIPEEGIEIGEKYLVQYNNKNPQECRMIFDKPIKSNNDFEAYMNEIKKTD